MNHSREKNTNKVVLVGIGLILMVISVTLLKPVLKKGSEKESASSEPNAVYSDYKYITSKELREKIINGENVIIIDIRDSVSFKKEHIEDSINITPDQIAEEVAKLDKKSLIVIVGYNFEDKNAEAGAVKFFKDYGFEEVMALSGGIFAWKTNSNSTIGIGNPESIVDQSKVEKIIPAQLKLAIENDYPVFIIDTRSTALFAQGHIPSSINIPLDDLERRKEEISSSKEIIVYGDSELSDFQASVKLHDLGFLANYTIDGGFSSWQEKRFPIEK